MNEESRFVGKVRGLSIEGYGVVDHPENSVFFVLGTFPGDEGLFEVIRRKGRYGYARLIELHQASPDRVPAPCRHSGIKEGFCGGCPWMELSYPKQMEYKRHMLQHALKRCQLWPEDREPPIILGSGKTFGFRNRAQFKTDGDKIGFSSRFSRALAPIEDCPVLNEPLRELLKQMIHQLPKEQWRPTPPHSWSFLDIDDETNLEEVILNKRRPFKQGNSQQNARMRAWVEEKTRHWRDGTVIELFAGSGNFTEVLMAAHPKHLVAVDISVVGIQNLQARNLGTQCSLVEANMFKPSDWKLLKGILPRADFLFLDPPRDGFNKLDMFVNQWGFPREIIYISCCLETYVNDVSRLKKRGYVVAEILGIDQFPHTPHIEILSVLKR